MTLQEDSLCKLVTISATDTITKMMTSDPKQSLNESRFTLPIPTPKTKWRRCAAPEKCRVGGNEGAIAVL